MKCPHVSVVEGREEREAERSGGRAEGMKEGWWRCKEEGGERKQGGRE